MGFDNSMVQFLCAARRRGVDFGEAATLGRQKLFATRPMVDRVLKELDVPAEGLARMNESPSSEAFLELLGARRVDSVDYSAFEGATIVHDLNGPLAPELRERFDVLIDGGTMEHVFNVPQALKNAMGMVRVGGWFVQITAANNFMGHGFWQFSPELAFRCFTPDNGFDPPSVLLKEQHFDDRWHEVRDPKEVRSRVELRNSQITYVCVLARKREDVEPFATPPYQSDYVTRWEGGSLADAADGDSTRPRTLASLLRSCYRSLVPAGARMWLRSGVKGVDDTSWCYNPAHYRRVPLDALLRGEFDPSVPASSRPLEARASGG